MITIASPKKLVILVFFLCSFFCVNGKAILSYQVNLEKGSLINPIQQWQYGFCSYGQLPVLNEFQKNLTLYRKSLIAKRKRKGKVAYAAKQIFFS